MNGITLLGDYLCSLTPEERHDPSREVQATAAALLALLVPMLIHGTYDTFAFLGERGTIQLLILVVLLYIAAITMINKMSKADYRAGFYPSARNINIDIDL